MFYRLHSLDKSCDGFPTCLILLTDIDSANTVVAHSRLSKVHGKTNACLVESGIYIYTYIQSKVLQLYIILGFDTSNIFKFPRAFDISIEYLCPSHCASFMFYSIIKIRVLSMPCQRKY